jgi:hypothetical protein
MGLCLPGVMGPGGEQTATACLNRKRGQPVPVRSHRAQQRRAEVHSLAALHMGWSKTSQTHNANMTVAALITPHTHENRVPHSQSRRQAIVATWLGGRVRDMPRRWVGPWGLLTVAFCTFLDNNF